MYATGTDTIVAISSAAGRAARAIVRLSGPAAMELAAGVFRAEGGDLPTGGFLAVAGRAVIDADAGVAVPARAYVFRAPRSYTRQDVVELHLPGSVAAERVRAALESAGARPAGAGEFTARAFLSGRVDLSAAEAVADVIDAEADAQLRSAVAVAGGALRRLCGPAAETLADARAMVEVSVDFADEDLAPLAPADLAGGIAAAAGALREALDRCGRWSPASAEPRVAIAGRPNAGKSSLLNALSGVDRAIVSAMAGTTRDVLTAPAALPGGLEVILLDAAGLHAGDDPLDRAAHRAARDAVTAAEAVLYVLDAAEARRRGPAAEAELLAEVRRLNRRTEPLVLANKADLLPDPSRPSARLAEALGAEPLAISTATGAGLEELRAELADRLAGSAAPRSAGLLLHDRQRRAIAAAAESAERAAHLLASAPAVADVAELAAADLADASAHLAELTGEVLSEDLLDMIFARFCIGK